MKLRNKILLYLVVPLGVLIKVAIFILLLNLPEGYRERNKSDIKDTEVTEFIAPEVRWLNLGNPPLGYIPFRKTPIY